MKRKFVGTLIKNIRNLGDAQDGKEYTFKKGQKVIVWKRREFSTDNRNAWTGRYEYHYSDENGKGIVRMRELLLEEFNQLKDHE